MSQRDERGACVADLDDDAIARRRRATGTGAAAAAAAVADGSDMVDIVSKSDLPAAARRMRRMLIRQEKFI